MGRAQRDYLRAGIATALLFGAACSSSSTPSTFGSGGGSEGGVTDSGSGETGSFGGSSGGGTFQCGAAMCTRYDYCLFIVSDAGAEMSATCNLLGNCGDCNCVMQMVSTAQCAGLRVTCTTNPPYTVSCLPAGSGSSSGAPGDSGSAD